MLISTGITSVPFSLVASLNLLTKSPILTPCWPSAGPIGGAGLALPAGICNFTTVFIFFAICFNLKNKISNLFHLQIIYFYGSFPPEHSFKKRIHLFFVKRNGSRSRADETGNSGSVSYDIPRIIGNNHIHQNVTGIYFFLNRFSFPADYFYLFFRGNDGAENFVLHAQRFNSLLQISDNGVLISGVSMNGVPVSSGLDFLLCHILQYEFPQ